MLKVPLPWLTFVNPPNALLVPDFCCSRAALTPLVADRDVLADAVRGERELPEELLVTMNLTSFPVNGVPAS